MARKQNVVRMHHGLNLNIGIVIFVIIIIYVIFNLLSYLTLHPENWQQHSYIAMNGVYENAVLTALEHHSSLDEIVFCTDNDEGGIDAVDRLTDILKEHGYENISRIAPENKAFNEDL